MGVGGADPEAGFARCAYLGCRRWVRVEHLYCPQHAEELGLEETWHLCRATTASGRRCRRRATTARGLCRQHWQLQYKHPWEP